ncbi:MAG: TetR/AcrR family transcriptional regulator [Halioglobus sp.]
MGGKTAEKRRRKPSQARSRRAVASIIEAAAQVLERWGYQGATTNRIAERAGVSVGTLYQYFNNKDEIFNALIERETTSFLDAIEGSISGPEVENRTAIRRLLEAAYASEQLVLGVRQVMRNLPSQAYSEQNMAIRREMHSLVMRFLELRGAIPELDDISLTADVFIAQCEGMTYLGRISRNTDELVDILTDSLYRYLYGPKG